ncbi:MAG TPA: 2-polyprenylphenol 6-hydroxylase [Hyphomicrobiales bacterium]|nr:2-polyprenylphenol 6-hydroxylase [Hyphomicrobiales bacterium]
MLRTLSHLARLVRVTHALAREGVLELIDPTVLPRPAAVAIRLLRLFERPGAGGSASRMSAALTRLGPSYVKLGQFLATRPDVVGPQLAAELEQLQDRMPPFGMEAAKDTIQRALGRPVEALFVSFSEPVAAASIAQVHAAVVRTAAGERRVAVKVLRPGVAQGFRRDLDTFYWVARLVERWYPAMQRLRPVAVVDTLARTVTVEMDLRLEAAALSEMAENTARDPGFRVPAVEWERTAREVLTLEWVDGIPLAHRDELIAAGFDVPALGRLLIQSFLRQAMRDGFFHADLHPGNLFVDAAGRLVAIDFGITGRLGPKERRFLAEILYGFIRRDYRRVAEVHFEAGYVPEDQSPEEFARALRAIGEPIHDRTAEEISMARLLNQLFEVTDLFHMRTRPELILLQKTMIVVEGVARRLDPHLDIGSASAPVVQEWIARNLGPAGIAAEFGRDLKTIVRVFGNLPELLLQTERLMDLVEDRARSGFHLAVESAENLGNAQARAVRVQILAQWLTALALLAIAGALIFG